METVKIANYFDLIGGTLIAGDSTKFRAQNSKKNNFNHYYININQILRHFDRNYGLILTYKLGVNR